MRRITERDLQQQIDRLNQCAGTPQEPYIDGVAQVGNYHLSFAYGGVALHQMHPSGGVIDVFRRGHMPKRELHNLMFNYTPKENAA